MAATHVRPQTLEEKVVFWSIVATWAIWVVGGLYILAPAMGWLLAALALARLLGLAGDDIPYPARVPLGAMVWIAGMGMMLVALLVGHIELGIAQTLKSFMGWMKGWALIAVFVFVGAIMSIRPAVIYRASNVLAAQTLALTPIFYLAGVLHLPSLHYISPLVVLGGSGPEYFTVELYGIEPETGAARWSFFAPWAPAAALISNVGLVFALFDKDWRWKAAGILATLIVCYMSQSRLGLIVAPAVGMMILGLSNLTRPLVHFAGTAACIGVIPFTGLALQMIDAAQERFTNARASSSRVRATLQSIAIHRWWNEAPIWGHGIVEKGPHLVEYMPIGSHHTWNGLLYVKGIVGLVSLAVPMGWTLLEMILKAQTDRIARAGLGVMLVLFIYTFAENLESLIYLYWPGMVVVGAAMKRRVILPFHRSLGC